MTMINPKIINPYQYSELKIFYSISYYAIGINLYDTFQNLNDNISKYDQNVLVEITKI